MPIHPSRLACCLLAVCASGCSTTRSYVENGHDVIDYSELRPRTPPTPVQLKVLFSSNGVPNASAQTTAYNEVARTLLRTRVLLPVNDPSAPMLEVSIDDQYDASDASRSGWKSGLTWGADGASVRDDYQFGYSLISTAPGIKPKTALYRQAMITQVGKVAPPGYGQPQDMGQAFSVIVKQSVLAYLHDLEDLEGGEPVMIVPAAR